MRAVRFLLGVLLIPVCVATTRTAISLIETVQPDSDWVISPSGLALVGGYVAWLLVYFTLPRPVRTYVLAHELTHALWGTMMGARVSRMRVSGERGSVTLSKINFLITLAPYFFPLYTIIVIAGYYILSIFFAVDGYHLYWLALVGFTWGFHFTFTVSTLLQRQSDIREYGRLFSYGIIYQFNVLGMCVWVVMVSAVTLEDTVELMKAHMCAVTASCTRAGQQIFEGIVQ